MNHDLKMILPKDLVCLDDYVGESPLVIDLAYARDDNLLFGERIYSKDAKLWLYKDLAAVVLEAAKHVFQAIEGTLIIYDGLRVTDAQNAMLKTQAVQENPHWLEEPRLLSPPGAGGHPRAMAVDVSILDADGKLLDMGTDFDDLTQAAHRGYPHPQSVQDNRALLDDAMMDAAQDRGVDLVPLPQEWWDYRLPAEIYEQYAPLSDADLPHTMQLMD